MKGEPRVTQKLGDEVFRFGQSAETQRIVEALRNDRATLQTLEATLATEPVFTSHLLTLITFAAGLSEPLLSLAQALGLFGLDYIKPLALALLAFDLKALPVADENDRARQPDLRGLWEHALGSAVIASRMAAEAAAELPLHAFTAGFIHDIGRVLLWRYSPQAFSEAQRIAQEQKIALRDAEKAAYGLDHVSVATDWCRRFDLSMQLQDILRLHHEALAAVRLVTSARAWKTIALLQAAEFACSRHAIGASGESIFELADSVDPWSALGLREADWFDRCAAAKQEIEAARGMFGFVCENDFDSSRPRPARRAEWMVEKKNPAPPPNSAPRRGQVTRLPIPRRTPSAIEENPLAARKLVLLVVEDHGSLCDMVSLFLMRHGYHVRSAGDGESALEILSRETIHLVLLDLMLPKLDGFQVLRQMQTTQRERFPYIIVVSAGASEMDRKKVLDLGANEYMAKPFHLNRLLERVQAVEKFLY